MESLRLQKLNELRSKQGHVGDPVLTGFEDRVPGISKVRETVACLHLNFVGLLIPNIELEDSEEIF